MLIFLSRLSLVLFLIGCSFAKAVQTPNSLEQSNKDAEAHPLKVNCGTIRVCHSNGKNLLDYCSAVVVGSQTILSACHILHDSRKEDPGCYFLFRNYEGNVYPIHLIRGLAPPRGTLDPNDDLALFYLKEPIPFASQIKLATSWPQSTGETKLFSLTYGWKLTSESNQYTVRNTDGKKLYYTTGTYSPFEKTYIQEFDADRAVRTSIQANSCRELYVGKAGSPPQILFHDSGSPWFQGNDTEGYTLCGISSVITRVDPNDIQGGPLYEGDFLWIDAPQNLKVFPLKNPRRFNNRLTAIAPHAPWIEQCVNKFD